HFPADVDDDRVTVSDTNDRDAVERGQPPPGNLVSRYADDSSWRIPVKTGTGGGDDWPVLASSSAVGGLGEARLISVVTSELSSRMQRDADLAFVDESIQASRMPLRNTLVPPDVVPELGGKVVFQLPEGTFDGGDGVIWLYATLRDGTPLPDWIQFDGATGRIEADVPDSLAEPLEIRVQARDAHGETAETVFKILPRAEGLGFSGKPSLTAQFQQMMD
ncbi:MAG TPA: putative Ig domain-containing protein, partial [Orrella sp.]